MAIWWNLLFTNALEESSAARTRFPQECYLSLTTLLLNLSHHLGLHPLLFFLVCLNILHGDVMNMCLNIIMQPIHT